MRGWHLVRHDPCMTTLSSSSLQRSALASGSLLVALCGMTLVTGVSQQLFEWVHPPAVYAAWLIRDATPLRAIIAVDDLFITAYVAATVLFVRFLGARDAHPLHLLALGASVAAGLLDLAENHHLLALLRAAEGGETPPLEEILLRSQLSQLKWMLGHAAFALIGMTLAGRDVVSRVMHVSLVYVQLPLGAVTWAIADGPWLSALVWLRYAALVLGFYGVAFIAQPRAADAAVG